jgi:hypothetical protein
VPLPPVDFTVLTKQEPPKTGQSSPQPANPFSPIVESTPPDPFLLADESNLSGPPVRRGAVSYRRSRPLIPSASRQAGQRLTPVPARTLQGTPESPESSDLSSKTHFRTPGGAFSFSNEAFSSSPLAEQFSSEDISQNPATLEARTSETAGEEPVASESSSSTNNESARALQGENSSQTDSRNIQSPEFITDSPLESDWPVFPKSSANPKPELSSSASLAAFDFGFGKNEAEQLSETSRTHCDTPPNTPAQSHPNFASLKFSFPTLESTPEEASEGKKSVEPSLPAPSNGTGRRPRGLSSAIAQACGKFESEAHSGRAEAGVEPSGKAFKRTGGPQLELPASPGYSADFTKVDSEEPALSEVARGKRPERRNSTSSRRRSSEEMDLLNPESAVAMTQHRREAVRMAKSQEAAVVEKCKRSGVAAPQYTFDELIGKGSYGRVYKGWVCLLLHFRLD